MTTSSRLPGSDAARHGSGDADLTIMLAAHDAFRRDLVSLARAARDTAQASPAKRQSVAAGWDTFKRQLHLHHTAEDEVLWPALRERLANSQASMSVLAEMEAEHALIDPLLASVDVAFGSGDGDVDLPDAVEALMSALSGHLAHEEKDGLPLIGVALTKAEWRAVGRKLGSSAGLSNAGEMFAWMLSGTSPERLRETLASVPPPLRVLYKMSWRPKYAKTARW
jgi:hemerythrin-like domain-containing protein